MGNNLRTTVILVAVAVGLSLYAYYFERGPAWDQPVGGVFTEIVREDVVELDLVPGPASTRTAGEESAQAIRMRYAVPEAGGRGTWAIVEPIRFPCFVPRIQSIVRSVLELQRIKSVPEETADEFFRDDGTSLTVRFATRGGAEHTIEIGREHPEEFYDLVCVRVDGADVFHTRAAFRRNLNSTLDELRSRALFPVPKERAIEVVVESPSSPTLTLRRELGSPDWTLGPPAQGVGDRGIVTDLLDSLNAWRIETFVTDSLEEPARYGFDRPRFTVTLTSDVEATHRYEVAGDPRRELADGMVYVRDPREPFVYSARLADVARLELPAEEFRSQVVFQLGASKIVSVEGSRRLPGEVRSFRLTRVAEEATVAEGEAEPRRPYADDIGRWTVEDLRLGKTYAADSIETGLLLRSLEHLPVRRYLDDPEDARLVAGAEPILELDLALDTGKEYGVEFFEPPATDAFPAASYLLRRSGVEGLVLVISPLPRQLEAGGIFFRDRYVAPQPAEDVREFELETRHGSWRFGRLPSGDWRLAETATVRLRPDERLAGETVNRVVRLFSREDLRVETFLADRADAESLDAMEVLPEKHRYSILFLNLRGEPLLNLLIGAYEEQAGSQVHYAKLSHVDVPVALSHDYIAELVELIDHLDAITD
jgi:hypothetical protein